MTQRTSLLLILLLALSFSIHAEKDPCADDFVEIVAPPDMVVSCCYWFSLGMLEDPSSPMFGRMVYGRNNIKKVKTWDKVCQAWCEEDDHSGYDPLDVQDGKACHFYQQYYDHSHPLQKYPLIWGWDGYITNAPGAVSIDIDDRRGCGTGLIVRRFSVVDRGVTFYDDQRIWIVDCQPFYINPDNCFDPDDNIEWPLFCAQPNPLNGCNADLSPDNPLLGKARVVNGGDDQCNLISVDYEDYEIVVEENACLKILRTWVVIDWCQYHPLKNPYRGRWEYLQVIKVRDKEDPEIACTIGDCHPAVKNNEGICEAEISLRAIAMDSCTIESRLRYEYKIDLYNDGNGQEFDLFVGPLTLLSEIPVEQDNPYATFPDSANNASGTYPVGTHRIKWFVEDGCGNVAICDTTFEVKDCKEPTPYCKTGIITVVMPASEEIDVWASDLNDGSFDNCTLDSNLVFSFSSDILETSRTFDCDDIGTHTVQIWVTDEEGNQDYCETTIEIQDPQGVCGGNLPAQIAGHFVTMDGGKVINVQNMDIYIEEDGEEVDRIVDLQKETFEFDLTNYDGKVTLHVEEDDNPKEEVSTSDLIMIYRHLLGRLNFSSVCQKIAADVNDDCEVSGADIVALRRMLVGEIEDLSEFGLGSWKYMPYDGINSDTSDPCLAMNPHEVVFGRDQYNFIPIKLGNVNSNIGGGLHKMSTRSEAVFDIKKHDELPHTWKISARSDWSISGVLLEYDGRLIELGSSFPELHKNQYQHFDGVRTKVGSYAKDDINLSKGDDFFSLVFPDQIEVDALIDNLQLILVDGSYNEFEAQLIGHDNETSIGQGDLEIFPNPSFDHVNLRLLNELSGEFSWDIMASNGSIVLSGKINVQVPTTTIPIAIQDMRRGTYFLRLSSVDQQIVRPFVKH